jgi:lipid II isoglutaminyl synthase (glutamine-hydrolysing)
VYEAVFSSHMGRYRCPHCGLERPAPDVKAAAVHLTEAGSQIEVLGPSASLSLALALPGLYNAYNALAATAVALSLGVPPETIVEGISAFKAAFGRVERLQAGDRSIELLLVKNPTGFNEVLRTVFPDGVRRHVLILINDLLADGTDVSWLWDVDFEAMQGKVARATVGGIRAHDMALRLRYADVQPADGDVAIIPDIGRAIGASLEATPAGETLYILPTYTAMLSAKTELARSGLAPRWQDD